MKNLILVLFLNCLIFGQDDIYRYDIEVVDKQLFTEVTENISKVKFIKYDSNYLVFSTSKTFLGENYINIKCENIILITDLVDNKSYDNCEDFLNDGQKLYNISDSQQITNELPINNKLRITNPANFMLPTINSSVQSNYSINNNDVDYLETMTYSIKSPVILLFFSMQPENGTYIATMNQLKKKARNKYGSNIGFSNVISTKRTNYNIFNILPPWILFYTQEVIISADIIRFKN